MKVDKLGKYPSVFLSLLLGFVVVISTGCSTQQNITENLSLHSSDIPADPINEELVKETSESILHKKDRILEILPSPSSVNSGAETTTIQVINLSSNRRIASVVDVQLQFVQPVSDKFSYYSHPDGMRVDLSDQLAETLLFYPPCVLEAKPELSQLLDLVENSYPDPDLNRVVLAIGNDGFLEKLNECYIAIIDSDMQKNND